MLSLVPTDKKAKLMAPLAVWGAPWNHLSDMESESPKAMPPLYTTWPTRMLQYIIPLVAKL